MNKIQKSIYDLVSSLPPASAQIVAGMIVNEGFHYALGDADIDAAYLQMREAEVEHIKKQLIRSYLAKRQSGESIDSIVAAAEVIAKAQNLGPLNKPEPKPGDKDFDPTKHPRGYHGWFKTKPNTHVAATADSVKAVQESFNSMARAGAPVPQQTRADTMAFVPGVRNAQMAGAGANFLNSTVGGYLPAPAQIGLSAAGLAGQFAPQAQLAFGPAVDRAKYRYQGVERKLDPTLMNNIKGEIGKPSDWAANRDKLIYANEETDKQGNVIAWTPSATMTYIRNKWLPNEKLANLQRMSGHQPPSQGIMIDAKGQVSAQMVGEGDDWYLPFNLANLGNLKGGEYIRTRTNGGLTTEDVYTGLMAGARSMSVVSHNGVYTMEFDDTLRGSRRYSQSARQMTERYGQLLDAVKEGKVPYGEIDPVRVSEIREEVGNSPSLFNVRIQNERENPRITPAMQREWGNEWLDGLAEHRGYIEERVSTSSRSGSIKAGTALVNREVLPKLRQQIVDADNEVVPGYRSVTDPDVDQEARALVIENPRVAAETLGLEAEYDRYMNVKGFGYLKQLEPMTLNGPGYDFAMQALQEQFPYYIKKVKWHPWNENRFGAGEDQGYVRARYNRSADVMSGYFDPDILGYGKVPAARTRFQNARVTRTIETGYQPSSFRDDLRRPTEAAVGTQGAGGTQGTAGTKEEQKEKPLPEAKAAQKIADLQLVRAFARADKFSGQFDHPRLDPNALRNVPADEHRRGWMNQDPDMKYFGSEMLDKYKDMPPDELHKNVQKMVELNEVHHIFDVDDAVKRWRGMGADKKANKVEDIDPTDPHLIDSDEEFDLRGIVPDAVPGKNSTHYDQIFYTNPGIKHLYKNGFIPDINSPDLPDKAGSYIADMQQDIENNQERGLGIQNQVRGIWSAVLARQLHRWYVKASPSGGGAVPGGPAPKTGGPRSPVHRPGMEMPSPGGGNGVLIRLGDQINPGYTNKMSMNGGELRRQRMT